MAEQMSTYREEKAKDKVIGCMVGGAAGDALGYAVEFCSLGEIRRRYGSKGITRYELDSRSGKALISDDTQMSLFTAAGCLLGTTRGAMRGIMGRLSGYCYFTYQNWFTTQTEPYRELPLDVPYYDWPEDVRIDTWLMRVPGLYSRRAPGNTCLEALHALRRRNEDYTNNSCGCGGVMRTAPIALACFRNDHDTADEAANAARITHFHPLGFLPSAMLHDILTELLRSEESDRFALKNAIIKSIQQLGGHRSYVDGGSTYAELYPKAVRTLVDLVNKALELADSDMSDIECIESLGLGWTGHEALAIAIFCAVRHADSFEDAIIAAVNHNGDSDSTGSICGNIMGTLLGRGAIPEYYTKDLELIDVIEEMAEDLFNGCPISEYCEYRTAEQYRWSLAYMESFIWKPKKQMLSQIRDGSLFAELGWSDSPKEIE